MAVIKLIIYVPNLANVLTLFDKMEVARSENGEPGPYFPIMDTTQQAATLTGTAAAPFTLNGTTLKLKVDEGAEQTLTFVTADPINIDDTVDFINDHVTDYVASEDGGKLKLSSLTVGTASVLEITGGTALTELGFTVGDRDTGEDERISLSPSQDTYQYDDQSGYATYLYKTRYYNSTTGQYSGYSDPVEGNTGSVVPSSNLITAKIDLANIDGSPVAERVVTFYNKYIPPMVVADYLLAGRVVAVETDFVGHAETMLVKGSTVTVTIAGTNIVRDITVPTTGTEFSVTDAIAAADDVFQVQVDDIPPAVRRTI